MRPSTFVAIAVTTLGPFVCLTATEARPAGAQHGPVSVHAGSLSARGDVGQGPTKHAASFRMFGSASSFGRGDRRGLNFADSYGRFGYGAYGTSGYYGYGSGGYADDRSAGIAVVSPYGPLVTQGYSGMRDTPAAPPAIYVIDKPLSLRSSASRRSAGDPGLVTSGAPERAGAGIIQVRR